MYIFYKFEFFGHSFRSHFAKISLIKSRNQNIFEKFKLNRNLQTIPFKMIYNLSILRHRFSNERWGEAPLTTFLSYSVKVYITYKIQQRRSVLLSYDSSKTSPTNFETIPVFILHYTRREKLD